MVDWAVSVLSLFVFLVAPLVAYPLAMVLRRGRQAIDDMVNWRGKNHEQLEAVEDALTHSAVLFLAILILIGIGAIYTWYVHTVVFETHPWLYSFFDRFIWIDLGVEFINSGVMAYWVSAYGVFFAIGWLKAGRG